MATFDRRSFLTSIVAAAGTAAMPEWLARGMAPQDPVGDWRLKELRAAVGKAKDVGKPLLVFVAPQPADGVDGFSRGQWLGTWLNQGDALMLQTVGTCELACASLDEVVTATGCKRPAGAPVLLLIDVARVGEAAAPEPKTTAIAFDFGPVGPAQVADTPEKAGAQMRKFVETGCEKATTALQDGLNRHGATLAKLASDVTERLTAAQREQLAAWLGGGAEPTEELMVRAAAEVRRAAGAVTDWKRKAVLAQLTAAVDKQVVKKHVAGARWQRPGGCGSEFEDPTPEEKKVQGMVACGMGMVSMLSTRFLNFYVAGT